MLRLEIRVRAQHLKAKGTLELRVRVQHLKAKGVLRHATVKQPLKD